MEVFVSAVSDMKSGDRRIVRLESGKEVGVFFVDGEYYGYSNYCAHAGGPVCEGILVPQVADVLDDEKRHRGQTFTDETHFVCPWHGYEYDIKTGECVGDRKQKLRKFEVVKRGGEIYVVA